QLLLNSNSTKELNSNTPSKLDIFLKGISFFDFLSKIISTPPYKVYNYFHYIYNIRVKVAQYFLLYFYCFIDVQLRHPYQSPYLSNDRHNSLLYAAITI